MERMQEEEGGKPVQEDGGICIEKTSVKGDMGNEKDSIC